MNWKLIYTGFFPGAPVATGRARHGKFGTYTPPRTKNHMKIHAFQSDIQYLNPIKLVVTFVHPRPQRIKDAQRTWKTTTPDLDNLIKMVMDIVTRSGLWKDDNQVVCIEAQDMYASKYETAHTTFNIYIQE